MADSFQERELELGETNPADPNLDNALDLECDESSLSTFHNPGSEEDLTASSGSPHVGHFLEPQQAHELRVYPNVRGSTQDYQNLVPGQLAEQVVRFERNKECSPWPVYQSPTEMAEAGFYIADNRRHFLCQYCNFQVTFQDLTYDCDLWRIHNLGCYHLRMHRLENQDRDTYNFTTIQSTDAMLTVQQSAASLPIEQQSRNISGQSADAVSSPSTQEAVIAEMVQQPLSQNTLGSQTGSQETMATDSEGHVYILYGRVKFRQYAEYSARLQTFSRVPSTIAKLPKELVNAGFMYAGRGDKVICFSCGKGFENWQTGDDVWLAHEGVSPDCTYLTKVKGSRL